MSDKRLILAANVEDLPEHILQPGGFTPDDLAFHYLDDANLWFGPREVLEDFDAYRQIIPYIIATHKGAVVAYTRTPKGGESRLHSKVSIGLGGHVDIGDARVDPNGQFSLMQTLSVATIRELQEELGLTDVPQIRTVGLLALNDTEVDRVHIGLVGIVEIEDLPSPAEIEDHLENVSLVTVEDLEEQADRLENWTKVLLPHLKDLI